MVKVIGSHSHLPLSDVKGVGSVPPPLDKALHQGSTRRLLQKETDDRLKTRLSNIASSFGGEKVEPLHYLIGAFLTSIRG